MDVSLSPLVALLLVALLSRLILVLATRTTKGGSPSSGDDDGRRRLPPSPPGLPLLGHLPLLLGSLPHRRLQAMAASHGSVVLLRMGRVPTVVASSAAAAQEVMKVRDLAYASRPRLRMAERLLYGRDMAFAPYGERWRQARRVSVLHLLSHRRVLFFRRAREQEAAAMVARVSRTRAAAAAVNLNAALISYSSGIISRAALGVADVRTYGLDGGGGAAGENLTKLFDDFEALLGTVTVGELLPWLAWVDTLTGLHAKAARTSAEMDAFLERVIADHRQRRRAGRHREGGDGDDHRDFVDVLLDVNEAEHDGDDARGVLFDNDSIKGIILVHDAYARIHVHVLNNQRLLRI
jgi:hypothetical protein